jgi:hypothetical protein
MDDYSFNPRYRHTPSHSSLMPDPLYQNANRDAFTPNQQALLASILRELQDANALNLKLATAPPNKYDLLWTLLLQTFAVLTGIVFGVFAILAWVASNHSNTLASESLAAARTANSLASRANEMGSSANRLAVSANIAATSANAYASIALQAQYTAQVTASAQAEAANKLALVAYCSNVPKNVR